MVSIEYTFHGGTAHAAGDPWDGRSALDAVELMDVGMNYTKVWGLSRNRLSLLSPPPQRGF
jgi:metal-dependent amidase/aminoacylase/carboxypeptidase family protein